MNYLSGQIPTTIGNLTKLETLDLSGNQLSGPIPAQIWTLTNLTALRLHSNGLTGEIPPEIKNLSRLKTLGLHINKLTGGIPPEIGQLLQLEDLYLYDNPLGGSIPSTLGQLTKLWRLDLRSSDLTGIIPQELENLPLTHLELTGNDFTGCIPRGLSNVQYNDIDWLMEFDGLSLCGGSNAPPSLDSATVDGNTLTLTYNERLRTISPPVTGDYAVTVDGTARALTGVSLSGSAVTLTLTSVVQAGQTVLLSYTPGSNPVEDPGGADAAALTNHPVANDTAAPPTLDSAEVDGAALTLTYDDALDEASKPATTAYMVSVDSITVGVTAVSVSGTTVTLTLASPVQAGQTVTATYVVPNTDPVQDTDGIPADELTDEPVNNVTNTDPVFTSAATFTVAEHTQAVGTVVAEDHDSPDNVTSYAIDPADPANDGALFTINNTGELAFREANGADYEHTGAVDGGNAYRVTVTVTSGNGTRERTSIQEVTVTVTNVDEDGRLLFSSEQPQVGTTLLVTVDDPDGSVTVTTWTWERSSDQTNWSTIPNSEITSVGSAASYEPVAADVGKYLRITADYSDPVGSADQVQRALSNAVRAAPDSNSAPAFPSSETGQRSVPDRTSPNVNIGHPVIATDPDNDLLTYSLGGTDKDSFDIVPLSGQLRTEAPLNQETKSTYTVTVTATDPSGEDATITVTITVADEEEENSNGQSTSEENGGGSPFIGGGPPSGPIPSDDDFGWTVTGDIDPLAPGNDEPTGLWGDGKTLWVGQNGSGSAADGIFVYDIASGDRRSDLDFELDETNRAPRGLWSDEKTMWVTDSGQNRIFAYGLVSKERLEEREIELISRNGYARGLWSDGERLWVLDSAADAVFLYDIETRQHVGEYALHSANDDPHGIWSDRVGIWVSDGGARKLFAYRVDGSALVRESNDDFTGLSRAGNNSPRGIWSDGDLMYVVDSYDERIYTYNMPDAIDARLASLALSDVDIGEFSSLRTEYTGIPDEGLTETTVVAVAAQSDATVVIAPPDTDGDRQTGHQVAVEEDAEVTATVISPDGTRSKVYRVRIRNGAGTEAAPVSDCGTLTLPLALPQGGDFVVVPAGASTTVVDLFGGTDVTIVWKYNRATRAWDLFYIPARNRNTFAITAGDLLWVVSPRAQTLTVEGTPSLIPSSAADLITLSLREGRDFAVVPAGVSTTAADLFGSTDVTIVRKYNRATRAWDLFYIPARNRNTFAITAEDLLWVVSPRAQALTMEGTPPPTPPVSDCGTLTLPLALPQGGDFVVVPAGVSTTAADLFGSTDVTIVRKYNRATRAWDLFYIPARNRNTFAITAEDLLWVVSPRAQTLTMEGTPPPTPPSTAELNTLTLREGRDFVAVPAGVSTTATDLFGSTDVTIVWKYNRATRAWDLFYIPARNRNTFAITAGDLLWVVSPRAQTLTG